MGYEPKSKLPKGGYIRDSIKDYYSTKGDTRSLDNGSYRGYIGVIGLGFSI